VHVTAAALATGTITIDIHRHTTVSLGTSFSQYRSKKWIFQVDGIIVPHIGWIDPIRDQLHEEPE
jgi:hypothetical protein